MTSAVASVARTGTPIPGSLELAGGAALTALGTALAVSGGAVGVDDGFVLCPLRRCSGGYCPGCGATRSVGALLRGDVGASIRLHPLVILWAVQLVVVGVWLSTSPERSGLDGARRWLRGQGVRLLGLNAVAMLVVWLVRLALGHVPVPFA